jgi:hypothetical protein
MQQADETLMLPRDVLYLILTHLEKLSLYRSRLVNRTWYHLIESNPTLLVNVLNKRIQNILTAERLIPLTNFQVDKNHRIMAARLKNIQAVVDHPLRTKALITAREQIRLSVFWHSFVETFTAIYRDIQNKFAPAFLFGNATPIKFLLALCVYGLLAASVAYVILQLRGRDVEFTDMIIDVPRATVMSLAKSYKYPAIFLFFCLFALRFRDNLQRAENLYQQRVVQEVHRSDEELAAAGKSYLSIQPAARMLTISWKRNNLLSEAASQPEPKSEMNDAELRRYKHSV